MYNQHYAGGYFPRFPREGFEEIFSYNEDDPDALKFSILGQIEKYRKNGAFYIRMCYPEYPEDFPCNEWTQVSNFMQDKVITDYNPIRITYPQNFDGLQKTTSGPRWASGSYDWSFSIGYTQGGAIPGAVSKRRVSLVELYLLAGMIKKFLTNVMFSISCRFILPQQNRGVE